MNKNVKMRDLTADDIGLLFDVLAAIGSDEIASLAEDPAVAKAAATIGSGNTIRDIGAMVIVKIVAIIIRNYRKCEPVLKKMLSSLSGMSEDEIGTCSAGTYAAMLHQMLTSEGMTDFFRELLPFTAAEEELQGSKS